MLLPQPLAPTKAVVLFAGNFKLMSSNTLTVGRAGYANETPFSSMSPTTLSFWMPSGLVESIRGSVLMTSRMSFAAALALVKSVIAGAIIVKEDVAMTTQKRTLHQVNE